MKKFLLFLASVTLALAQNVNVQKAGDGTNAITGNLVVGSGRSILPSGTGDIRATSVSPLFSVPWNQVNKTGSSLADLQTRSASDLSSGTLPDARFPAIIPAQTVGFNLTTSGGSGVGRMTWNAAYETADLGLNNNVTLQVGQENLLHVLNSTGTTLTDGQLVYISGASGQRPTVTLAQANSALASSRVIGMVTQTIADGATGFVTISGTVNNVNTNGFADGTPLWLSPTVPGGYTATQPSAPNHSVQVGYVVKGGSTGGGSIFVNVRTGYAISDLHDVVITAPVLAGSTLLYDAATPAWRNAQITAGTGLSATYGNATMTLSNAGVTGITGTANQITASASTGNVTLSLPSNLVAPGTFTVTGNTITGGAGGLTLNAGGTNQGITLTPSGTGRVSIPGSYQLMFGNFSDANLYRLGSGIVGTDNSFQAKGALISDSGAGSSNAQLTLTARTGGSALTSYIRTDQSGNMNFVLPATTNQYVFDALARVTNTTASTSTTSGAFTVAGGVGVAGSIYAPFMEAVNSQNGQTMIQARNANTGASATAALVVTNSSYSGGVVLGGTNLTNVGPLRANRLMLQSPFDANYLSGQHIWWAGTSGAGSDPANAVEVMRISGTSSGAKLLHSPQNSTQGGTGAVGIATEWRGATFTNNTASANSTVSTQAAHSFATWNYAAASANVTITDATTLYVQGPAASTNTTFTNTWGIFNISNQYNQGDFVIGSAKDVRLRRAGVGILDLRDPLAGAVGRLDINGSTSAALGLRVTGNRDFFLTATSGALTLTDSDNTATFALSSTRASTNSTTGALTVAGGAGIGGAVNVGSTTEATTGGAGSITTAGGIYAAKRIIFGGDFLQSTNANLNIVGGGNVYLKSNGALYLNNSAGNGTIYLGTSGAGNNAEAWGVFTAQSQTASTSNATGAIVVAGSGGLGVGGRTSTSTLNVGAANGTTIDLIASATATLDFPSVAASGGTQDLTITVTGASTGDVVQLGLPAAPSAGVVFNAFVSAANTVTVRATNATGSPIDPASASYRVAVTSF